MLVFYIIVFSILGSIGAVTGAALMLLFPEKMRRFIIPYLISYATGTLLGGAFIGLIPHALEYESSEHTMIVILSGILFFFLLEKFLLWRHCHNGECKAHSTAGPLILIGDAFHNLIDGVIISAAFLTSIPLGLTSSVAVIAHEIPQEVGDFAILLHSGYSKRRAYSYNILSSITTLPAAIISYLYLDRMMGLVPYILAFSAASFIYIAIADLIPHLQRKPTLGESLSQAIFIMLGVTTILIMHH